MILIEWLGNEWRSNKFLFFNEISCALTSFLSAVYMTFSMPNTDFMLLYIIYIINTINCIISSVAKKSFGILLNSSIYLILDIIGVVKLLIK